MFRICCGLRRAHPRLISAIFVCVILAGSLCCRTNPTPQLISHMASDASAADFVAAATFDGARHGFVFRVGDHGLGYYRDGGAVQTARQQPQLQQSMPPPPVMPPPPPRPPPPRPMPPQPPPAQPTADQLARPATSSFWQQLEEFTQALDGGGSSSSDVSKPLADPQPPRPFTPPRAPSPPARLPSPGVTETLRWRPHRRRRQQRSHRAPYMWPAAPHATQVAQEAQVLPQAQVHVQAQVQVQHPSVCERQVSATLTKWTEGTVPGSREWIQALRAHAHPPTGWAAEWTNM